MRAVSNADSRDRLVTTRPHDTAIEAAACWNDRAATANDLPPRRCDTNQVTHYGDCIACGATQGEACQAPRRAGDRQAPTPESRTNPRTAALGHSNPLIER
jgi:hypothetical protein